MRSSGPPKKTIAQEKEMNEWKNAKKYLTAQKHTQPHTLYGPKNVRQQF